MDKKQWFKQYGGLLFVVFGGIIFYKGFDNLSFFRELLDTVVSITSPIFIGLILAYFLSPAAIFVEGLLGNGPTFFKERKRTYSVLFVVLLVLVVFYLTITTLIPIIGGGVMDALKSIEGYVINFESNVETMVSNPDVRLIIFSLQERFVEFISNLQFVDPMAYIRSIFSAASTVGTFILGFVFCPYVLIERDRLLKLCQRVLLLFINQQQEDILHHYVKRSHQIFGSYIYGKFIDSLIIGIIAAFGFWMLGINSFILLGSILLVTNMIPYFGPFIGAVPVVFFTFITNDVSTALWCALFILALQQFDGLILGPAILGETVGISPFWVIFSITVFGGLWGIVGMFLGVPLICIFREMFNDFMTYWNKKKSKDVIL